MKTEHSVPGLRDAGYLCLGTDFGPNGTASANPPSVSPIIARPLRKGDSKKGADSYVQGANFPRMRESPGVRPRILTRLDSRCAAWPLCVAARPIHPVSITRFPSFRTQTLENLGHYL